MTNKNLTGADIFKRLRGVVAIKTEADFDKERELFYDLLGEHHAKIDRELELSKSFSSAIEVSFNNLLSLHSLNAGFIGWAQALLQKGEAIKYSSYTTPAGSKQASQAERKMYAEGEVADLKGMLKASEELQRNLYERIYYLRSIR